MVSTANIVEVFQGILRLGYLVALELLGLGVGLVEDVLHIVHASVEALQLEELGISREILQFGLEVTSEVRIVNVHRAKRMIEFL